MNSKTLVTQVKRELWENKVSFINTPIIISLLVILLTVVGTFYSNKMIYRYSETFQGAESTAEGNASSEVASSNSRVIGQSKSEPEKNSLINEIAKDKEAFNGYVLSVMYANCILLFLVFSIVLGTYALRCLFDDRKNKDILFWRSMPVSETTNVFVKLSMLLLVAPAIILVLNFIVTLTALLIGLVFFGANGVELGYLISSAIKGGAFYIPFQIFYELVFSLLMLLPIIGFAFFASAFAKKTPFFTFASPLVLIIAELILSKVFGISFGVVDLLSAYGGVISQARSAFVLQESFAFQPSMIFPLVVCIGVGATFIAGAIWLRNNRYEI
jgi:ABC-2 type transport system permease protein